MENRDLELLGQFVEQDAELKALWDQHSQFERMLDRLESKKFLNETEELEVKELKKKKLAGKTKLQYLLDKYRGNEE